MKLGRYVFRENLNESLCFQSKIESRFIVALFVTEKKSTPEQMMSLLTNGGGAQVRFILVCTLCLLIRPVDELNIG